MSRVKTLPEIARQPLLTKADIQRVLQISNRSAKKIYDRANKLDHDELGPYTAIDYKVRMSSVCKVLGLTQDEIIKSVSPYAPSGE